MSPNSDKPSLLQTVSRWLSTPVRDVILARQTGRGLLAVCLPPRLMMSDLPTKQLRDIDRVARAVSLRPSEKRLATEQLFDQFAAAQGQPPPYDLKNRKQRKALVRRLRGERDQRHPWDRWVNHSINFAYIALMCFVVGFPLWVGTRSPHPAVDYLAKLNATAAAVPEVDRAWPGYRAAILSLSPHIEIHYGSYGENDPTKDLLHYGLRPDDPLWSAMRTFLAEHAKPLAAIDRAARKPGLGLILRSDNTYPANDTRAFWGDEKHECELSAYGFELYDTRLPHIGPLRQLARLKAAEASAALEDRDADRFIDLLHTLHGLAAHTSETPLMNNGMTALSIDTLKISLVEDLLRHDRPWLTDDHLQRLADLLADRDALAVYRYDGEFMLARDILQQSFTDVGNGRGYITRHGMLSRITHPYPDPDNPRNFMDSVVDTFAACFFRFTGPSRRPLSAMIDEYETIVEHDMAIPIWESGRHRADDFLEQRREEMVSSLLLNFLMPPTHSRHDTVHLAECKRQAIAAVVALEQVRRATGDWPESLASLVPDYLPDVPRDPVDGRPLRYMIRDDRPLLYSLGSDRDDDGGHWPMTQDDSWRYEPQPEKPEAVTMVEDNESARWYIAGYEPIEDAPDGDWILFPAPEEPPAELPDSDATFGGYGGFGG